MKIEANMAELDRRPFDLNKGISLLESVITSANDKGIGTSYTIEEGVPQVILAIPQDQPDLNQSLNNAVKFTDQGGHTLVSSDRLKDGRLELHFAVKDTGIGIPADKMSRLFQSFNQIDAGLFEIWGQTEPRHQQKLTEMMDGMWAISKVGENSTFHFTFRWIQSSGMTGCSNHPIGLAKLHPAQPEIG